MSEPVGVPGGEREAAMTEPVGVPGGERGIEHVSRVGIVLVSHSAELAGGTASLAAQVSGGTVTIVAAGGTDDGGLGTSAAKVERGLALADSGAGVVVLPDLGSAVLTVRLLLPGDDQRVILADAPFVEGAVAATVAAAAGADTKAVAAAAEEAWHARKL